MAKPDLADLPVFAQEKALPPVVSGVAGLGWPTRDCAFTCPIIAFATGGNALGDFTLSQRSQQPNYTGEFNNQYGGQDTCPHEVIRFSEAVLIMNAMGRS